MGGATHKMSVLQEKQKKKSFKGTLLFIVDEVFELSN